MTRLKIFIVEDEKILRVTLTDDLTDAGYQVKAFSNPIEALNIFKKKPADVVIADIKMPQMDGLELLSKIKSISSSTTVIIMTAFGSVDSAVEAMKKGAYDYITKPFQINEILLLLERVKELTAIRKENIQLRSHFKSKYELAAFVGKSLAVHQTKEMIKTVMNSDATVLITGETGTGKELAANIIHYNSARQHKPFIIVSCAILSREIFESELFGHEKGAFTGATKDRPGRFEMADGGTIFLDDVDDIPLDLQVKLLRVLQERQFERVGGNETINVDVRVLASTKADLKKLVKTGRFREDLYYRLNIFPIHLAPIRERREDISELAEHFFNGFAPESEIQINPEVFKCFMNYLWPGNVRELKNVMERLLLLSKGQEINISYVPKEILQTDTFLPEFSIGSKSLNKIMAEIETNFIQQALQQMHGNQAKAAELLSIPPSTLRTKMEKYNLFT